MLFDTISKTFECEVDRTPRVNLVFDAFGLNIDTHRHEVVKDIVLPAKWDIIYITGISGSGKTTLLNELAKLNDFDIKKHSHRKFHLINIKNDKPIIENIGKTFEEALMFLNSVGLSEAFVYIKRYRELSEGQKYRYYLAKLLELPDKIVYVDEFVSVLDRVTAKIVAYNYQRIIRKRKKRLIVATSHTDLLEELRPSTVIDFMYSGEHKMSSIDFAKDLKPPMLDQIQMSRITQRDDLSLLKYHYKNVKLPAMVSDIFAFTYHGHTVGLVVVSVPIRTMMLDKFYITPKELKLFNSLTVNERRLVSGSNVVIISRVVTHPTFRGIGLASNMLKSCIPLINKRVVVISSVMSNYVGFCESAGMTHIEPKSDLKFTKLTRFFEERKIDAQRIYYDTEYRRSVIEDIRSNKKLFGEFIGLLETYIKKYFSALDDRGEEEVRKLTSMKFIEKYLLKLRPMNVKTYYKENKHIPIDFISIAKFRSKLITKQIGLERKHLSKN
jgi:ABC-type lipoprotein export system ATPase subunit